MSKLVSVTFGELDDKESWCLQHPCAVLWVLAGFCGSDIFCLSNHGMSCWHMWSDDICSWWDWWQPGLFQLGQGPAVLSADLAPPLLPLVL